MEKIFKASSIRLMRYLYSLGFDKSSVVNESGDENWLFEQSKNLQESLDFYFYMRKKNQE